MASLLKTPEAPDPLKTATDYGKPPDPPAAPVERPDYIPEKFWKDGKPDLEGLAKSYSEIETWKGTKVEELTAQVKADLFKARPEAPDKYEIKAIDGVHMDELAKHPSVQFWRKQAFESGASQEQFNQGIQSMIDILKDGGVDPVAEKAALGDNAQVRIDAVSTWAKATWTDPAEFRAVQQVAQTAAGIKALERLMNGNKPPAGNDPPPVQPAMTAADLKAMQADPKYWDPQKRDPAFVKQVEEGWAKLYPNK